MHFSKDKSVDETLQRNRQQKMNTSFVVSFVYFFATAASCRRSQNSSERNTCSYIIAFRRCMSCNCYKQYMLCIYMYLLYDFFFLVLIIIFVYTIYLCICVFKTLKKEKKKPLKWLKDIFVRQTNHFAHVCVLYVSNCRLLRV